MQRYRLSKEINGRQEFEEAKSNEYMQYRSFLREVKLFCMLLSWRIPVDTMQSSNPLHFNTKSKI